MNRTSILSVFISHSHQAQPQEVISRRPLEDILEKFSFEHGSAVSLFSDLADGFYGGE